MPYVYSLRDPDSEEEPVLGKRARVVREKRVTLGRYDLETALFALFKEKPQFKLIELEQRLNHPRGTLKAALKDLCDYDYVRKTY